MAVIKSGASSDQLTVDPTSKAARVTLYDQAGIELFDTGADKYMVRIPKMSGGTAGAGTIFAMRNTGSKTVRIRRIELVVGFSGTAAATLQGYNFVRFGSATPTGGTALVVVKKRNSATTSSIGDARFGGTTIANLTVTSVVFEAVFAEVCQPRQNVFSPFDLTYSNSQDAIELAIGEGLAIQTGATCVAGDTISGSIQWDEF